MRNETARLGEIPATLVYLDQDKYVFIINRAKDMIIGGGFNDYSIEVEHALRQSPTAMEAAVFDLTDEKWGERVSTVA